MPFEKDLTHYTHTSRARYKTGGETVDPFREPVEPIRPMLVLVTGKIAPLEPILDKIMTASRAPLATKKTQKNKDNELVVSHLWSLWHSLQELAENQSKKIPTKSIQNNNCFEWCDPTKGLSTQVLVLATIDRMLAREGYKRATFDISNLNHQYQHAKKKLCVDIAVTRLGVMAYAQAL